MRCLLLTVLLLVSPPVAAELVELDLDAAGDGLITWDTETDYEWLDLVATTDTSWNQIDSDFGGWLSAGFRRATGDEICELFRHMGYAPEPCPVGYPGLNTPLQFPASGDEVARHLGLLGVTWLDPSDTLDRIYAIGWFEDGSPSTNVWGQATVERQVYSNVPIDRARADVWTSVHSIAHDRDFKIDRIGHFMVRAGPTACNDGEDNDGDGLLDAGGDPGCDDAFDNSENSSEFGCDDGVDNDGDGLVDAAADPGCSRPDEPFEDSEDRESQHVLIIHTGVSPPVEALLATHRFSSVTAVRIDYADPPEPRVAFDYDAILAYTTSRPGDAEGLGDLLADYADTGGRVVVATAALSPPWNIAGRITEPGYSPLVSIGVNGEVSDALVPSRPRDWVFNGIDVAAVSFVHNSSNAHPELDPGATLLATDGEGHLMLARSDAGNVFALNVLPWASFSNNAAFYNLLANTLLPAPLPPVVGGVPMCKIKRGREITVLVPPGKVQSLLAKGLTRGECPDPINGRVLCKTKRGKRVNVLVPDSKVQSALDKGFCTLGEC